MGYTMTAEEVAYWQDQAALLDPDAYVYTAGTGNSQTVPTGERYYMVNGWKLDTSGGGSLWYHRFAHVDRALLLPDGTTITNGTDGFMYICQPELVVDNVSDDRYSDYQNDPRGLYFERLMRIGELVMFQLGATVTGSGQTQVAFPTDFTDGLVLQVSSHDVAWLIMHDDTNGNMNTLNEIGDSSPIRFAEACLFPFKRTGSSGFREIMIQGVSEPEGTATLTYVKLPSDW